MKGLFMIDLVGVVPASILNTRLIDLRCKHVLNGSTDKELSVIEYSKECNYNWVEWGSYSGHTNDLEYHLNKIRKMEEDNYNHAIRVVVCKYDFTNELCIWVDNLHSAIKYLRQYGTECKLGSIPFYVVDLTEEDWVTVRSHNGSVRKDWGNITGAVSSAFERKQRSNNEKLIGLNYIVGDFIRDNPNLINCR